MASKQKAGNNEYVYVYEEKEKGGQVLTAVTVCVLVPDGACGTTESPGLRARKTLYGDGSCGEAWRRRGFRIE